MVRCPPSPPSDSDSQMPISRLSHALPPEIVNEQSSLLEYLHSLHADEFVDLRTKLVGLERSYDKSWTFSSCLLIKKYVWFVLETWMKAAWDFVFYPTNLMDRISVIVFSFAACVIMTILLPWCMFCNIPLVDEWFDRFSRRMCNGVSMVNASYPTIFEELSSEQIASAREHLSQPIEESSSRPRRRVFNLDASKLLLQCSALMYERTSRTTQHAASIAVSHSSHSQRRMSSASASEAPPGAHIAEVCGISGAQAVTTDLHGTSREENTIVAVARDKLRLQYSTVSEMNSIGSAFCGLFWDPQDSFIIVAFKGTTPSDFEEWASDFTFQMCDAREWLPGFGRVHGGFMQKVFPRKIISDSRMPYMTIVEAIKSVSGSLVERSPGKRINVWITGHSLGCALASLVYSRLIIEPLESGDNIIVRDAYLFAAPVLCDAESANAFNGVMNHYSEHPRTIWRITNGKDAVATSIPGGGDNTEWALSPWNLFSFAHLGCEVKLRGAPERCLVDGTHITPGTRVVIESMFHLDVIQETPLRRTLRILQGLPLLGRILAHGTGFYWATLQGVGAGTCEWVEN